MGIFKKSLDIEAFTQTPLEWTEYDGQYDKALYDVLLDGQVYLDIWPNAGHWNHNTGDICSDDNRTPIRYRRSLSTHYGWPPAKMTLQQYEEYCKDPRPYLTKFEGRVEKFRRQAKNKRRNKRKKLRN